MAIAWRNEDLAVVSSTTSATIPEPSGTADGDILVAIVGLWAAATITIPSGWNSLGAYSFLAATGAACWIMRTSGTPANMDFTWSGNKSGYVSSCALSGGNTSDTTTPTNTAADSGTGADSLINPPVTASTFTAPVGIVGGGTNAVGSITAPSDATSFITNDTELLAFVRTASGTTYDMNAQTGSSDNCWIGFSLAFAEAAAAGGQPTMRRWGGVSNMNLVRPSIGRSW